jgi:hypothetical protein
MMRSRSAFVMAVREGRQSPRWNKSSATSHPSLKPLVLSYRFWPKAEIGNERSQFTENGSRLKPVKVRANLPKIALGWNR